MSSNLCVVHQGQPNNEQLKNIYQHRINKQFIGLSKVLADKKRVRLMAEIQRKNIQHRILQLDKQSKRSEKQIQLAKKHLHDQSKKKQRKKHQFQTKQTLKSQIDKQIQRLHHASILQRQTHKYQLAQALSTIGQKHRYQYQSLKLQKNEWHNKKRVYQTLNASMLKDEAMKIKKDQLKGKDRVQKYWMNKNKSYVKQYENSIKKQVMMKQRTQNACKYLEQRQSVMIDKLKYSQFQKDKYQKHLKKYSQLSLHQLENTIIKSSRNRYDSLAYKDRRSISTMENNLKSLSVNKLNTSSQSQKQLILPYNVINKGQQKLQKPKKKRSKRRKAKL